MKYASIAFLVFAAFFSATAAGEDSPELKAAIRERIKEVRARQEPLAIELEAMLAADTKLTFYSLQPNEDERWAFTGKKNGIDVLRGYPIRGRAVVSGKKEIAEIVRSLIAGIRESDGTVASCFMPHHGLTIERGEKKIDLVICFTCLEGLAFGAYASNQYLVTDTPLTVFNAALERHKLPLPEVPNSERSAAPERAAGRRLNKPSPGLRLAGKPVSSED